MISLEIYRVHLETLFFVLITKLKLMLNKNTVYAANKLPVDCMLIHSDE